MNFIEALKAKALDPDAFLTNLEDMDFTTAGADPNDQFEGADVYDSIATYKVMCQNMRDLLRIGWVKEGDEASAASLHAQIVVCESDGFSICWQQKAKVVTRACCENLGDITFILSLLDQVKGHPPGMTWIATAPDTNPDILLGIQENIVIQLLVSVGRMPDKSREELKVIINALLTVSYAMPEDQNPVPRHEDDEDNDPRTELQLCCDMKQINILLDHHNASIPQAEAALQALCVPGDLRGVELHEKSRRWRWEGSAPPVSRQQRGSQPPYHPSGGVNRHHPHAADATLGGAEGVSLQR